MSRTEKLRRLSSRLALESARLERLAKALQDVDVQDDARQVRTWALAAYSMHISLTELADASRDARGAKRRANSIDGEGT